MVSQKGICSVEGNDGKIKCMKQIDLYDRFTWSDGLNSGWYIVCGIVCVIDLSVLVSKSIWFGQTDIWKPYRK